MRVFLGENGGLRSIDGKELVLQTLSPQARALAVEIQTDPAQHFFKRPFTGIAYLDPAEGVKRIPAHPSTFYPGSPFDTFTAIQEWEENGRIVIPRMYVYPTTVCNASCSICQFNFRRKDKFSIPWDSAQSVIEKFAENSERLKAPSLIISGDGEPTMYPHLPQLLEFAASKGIRVFLTSNLILPGNHREELLESIAANVSMLTVSIKGLGRHSYNQYQGLPPSRDTLAQVLENVEHLTGRTAEIGRRDEILLGIASLVLPENTPHYEKRLKWFADHGMDYVYLNLVEPSPKHWGISFSPEEVAETHRILSDLDQFTGNGMLIRYSRNPFRETQTSVYYDATTRAQQDVCGSALWNPIVIPRDPDGVMLSCRNSDHFKNPEYWFSDSLKGFSFEAVMNEENRTRVMRASAQCKSCRLERQVRMFDSLLSVQRSGTEQGSFMLEFDLELLLSGRSTGAIAFEDTFDHSERR